MSIGQFSMERIDNANEMFQAVDRGSL